MGAAAACRKPDGTMSAPSMGMFNSAFTTGGAACTIKLVQSLTGIEINHYVQVDFVGFKTMWAPRWRPGLLAERGRRAAERLKLHPGTQKLSGDEALAYVRARYGIGGRVRPVADQAAAAVPRLVDPGGHRQGRALQPRQAEELLDAATKSMTLDKATHLTDLYSLATRMRTSTPRTSISSPHDRQTATTPRPPILRWSGATRRRGRQGALAVDHRRQTRACRGRRPEHVDGAADRDADAPEVPVAADRCPQGHLGEDRQRVGTKASRPGPATT